MDNKTTIKRLNQLIETCKDGEYGFRSSAEHAERADLRTLFGNLSKECRDAGLELTAMVTSLGGEAEDSGSVSGALHRGWSTIRAELSSHTDEALLEACEKGEDIAVEHYRSALDEDDLLVEARQLINRQYMGVKDNHFKIRTLRDQARVHA